MTIDNHQMLRLDLAGSVAIPAVPPNVGRITISNYDDRQVDLLQVERCISATHAVRWFIRHSDVLAMLRPAGGQTADDCCQSVGDWFHGEQILKRLRKKGEVCGVLYVKEDAQVLFQREAGITAAESLSRSSFTIRQEIRAGCKKDPEKGLED